MRVAALEPELRLQLGAGMEDGVARIAHCMAEAPTSAQPVRRCGTQQLHTDSPPGEMLLVRAATGHRD
eukprot:COSAG02_NODE_38333_length_430_cov_0.936556_1_plen_67_part_01